MLKVKLFAFHIPPEVSGQEPAKAHLNSSSTCSFSQWSNIEANARNQAVGHSPKQSQFHGQSAGLFVQS